MQVRIGRKRANDGLSVHLEINGATCSTARPVIVEATRTGAKTKRCRCCFTPARIAVAVELIAAAASTEAAAEGANYSAERLAHINAVGEFIQPTKNLDPKGFNPEYDEDRAAIAARHAAFWADDEPVVETTPAPVKLSTFGQLRAANLRTHVQPTGRFAHVRKAA